MSARGTGANGRMSKSSRGKGEREENQKSLDFKKDSKTVERKKVTFEDEGEEKGIEGKLKEVMKELRELRDYMQKEMCEVKKERKRQAEVEEGWKNKERNWEIRIRILEDKVEEIGKEVRLTFESRNKEEGEGTSESGESGKSRGKSRAGSSRSSYVGSEVSADRLSIREVEKLRKWVGEKERRERRNNIVIKGVDLDKVRKDMKEGGKDEWLEWVKKFIHEKTGHSGGVESCRISGKVIIVTLESEEIKRDIMRNKYKLKGEQFFIENDLTWEERKIQGRISKWAKVRREKGDDIKVAIGKVRIKGKWIFWEELERKMDKEREEGRDKIEEGGGKEAEEGNNNNAE